jgi:3-oxoacyl-[acyl-carrier protein] reductase
MLLNNKTAIITGTNRGIGRAILEAFAANGANIYAHARKETPEFVAEVEGIATKYSVEIMPLYFDVTDYAAMKETVKHIISGKRKIDVLVNNAGITYNALFQMTNEENLRQQFEVNYFSVFLFTQYISKLMTRQKSGSIINIASIAGEDGYSGKAAYGASKAAIIAMTKSIASELGEIGIRANAIAPGLVETEMLATIPENIVKDTINSSQLCRSGKPSEIADVAVFLASDLASYITGQVIRADGGLK